MWTSAVVAIVVLCAIVRCLSNLQKPSTRSLFNLLRRFGWTIGWTDWVDRLGVFGWTLGWTNRVFLMVELAGVRAYNWEEMSVKPPS